MNFSQAWDAGFKTILIFVGTLFLWLGLAERFFADRVASVLCMTAVAIVISVAFFVASWRRCSRERRLADAEIRALLAGEEQ